MVFRGTWIGTAIVMSMLLLGGTVQAAPDPVEARCDGFTLPGLEVTCTHAFDLPHFDQQDDIDYDALVARFAAPAAVEWRVEGSVRDASGVEYFSWLCEGALTLPGVDAMRHCESHRPAIVLPNGDYYVADVSGPQLLTVTAYADQCVPALPGLLCPFDAAVTFLLHA